MCSTWTSCFFHSKAVPVLTRDWNIVVKFHKAQGFVLIKQFNHSVQQKCLLSDNSCKQSQVVWHQLCSQYEEFQSHPVESSFIYKALLKTTQMTKVLYKNI